MRLTTEGLGIGALPVATVLDEWRRGELFRLALPAPLPAMHYDVIWRSTNHPRFCRGFGRLAQECADGIDPDRGGIGAGEEFEGLTAERLPLVARLHADLLQRLEVVRDERGAQHGQASHAALGQLRQHSVRVGADPGGTTQA